MEIILQLEFVKEILILRPAFMKEIARLEFVKEILRLEFNRETSTIRIK